MGYTQHIKDRSFRVPPDRHAEVYARLPEEGRLRRDPRLTLVGALEEAGFYAAFPNREFESDLSNLGGQGNYFSERVHTLLTASVGVVRSGWFILAGEDGDLVRYAIQRGKVVRQTPKRIEWETCQSEDR